MTDGPTRRPRQSAAQRREQILASARRLFAERGFHGTTTRDLSEAADVNDALLYRYFGSKRDILSAVMDEAVSVFSTMPSPPPSPPQDAARELPLETLLVFAGQTFVDTARAHLDLLTILIAEARNLPGETRFVEFVDQAATRLGAMVDRAAGGKGTEEGLHAGYLTARAYFGALISFVLLQDQLGLARIRPLDAGEYVRHLARQTASAL